jgi:hypothetical protein
LDRSLVIKKQLGNVTHVNLTKHWHFWEKNKTEGYKWKSAAEELKKQKTDA